MSVNLMYVQTTVTAQTQKDHTIAHVQMDIEAVRDLALVSTPDVCFLNTSLRYLIKKVFVKGLF